MKKVVALFLIVFLGLFIGYTFIYHKHRDIANEKAAFSVTVPQLLNDFGVDETKANEKYLDKSITVKGKITSIDVPNKTIVIDEKVFVILTNIEKAQINKEAEIQGRLIGFDSLLEEIKLDQAQIK